MFIPRAALWEARKCRTTGAAIFVTGYTLIRFSALHLPVVVHRALPWSGGDDDIAEIDAGSRPVARMPAGLRHHLRQVRVLIMAGGADAGLRG